MSAACVHCNDTGMLPGSAYLDCTHCEVAMQRVALETWATEAGLPTDEDELWKIYQHGLSVALEQAAKVCDDKYEARAATGHPREASTARALAEQIRALKP